MRRARHDLAITLLLCVLITCLTIGINLVRPQHREPLFVWWGAALIPACIALPQFGRYNAIAALCLCFATIWIVFRYLSDWDADIGLSGFALGFLALVAAFATCLSWANARGHSI